MADDLAATFERTREILQPIIAKPKCSDKLLNKPPFRFLHDVITNVLETTSCAPGLFTPEELDSAQVKEKQAKMDYLTKIISCLNYVSGETLDIRPSKVIAGLEPECTNAFLQTLGSCATSQSSSQWTLAIEQTLGNGTTADSEAKASSSSSSKPPEEAKKEPRIIMQESKVEEPKEEKKADEEQEQEVHIPVFDRPPTRQSSGARQNTEDESPFQQPAESKEEKPVPVEKPTDTTQGTCDECQ